MATPFEEGMMVLANLGVYDVVLPFIFVFAVLYGVIEKSKLLGEGRQNISMLIAFVVAFVFIAVETYVGGLNNFLVLMSLFFVMIIMLYIVMGMFGAPTMNRNWLMWGMLIVVVGSLLLSFGIDVSPYIEKFGAVVPWSAVLVIVVLGLVIAYILRDPEAVKKKKVAQEVKKGEEKKKSPKVKSGVDRPDALPVSDKIYDQVRKDLPEGKYEKVKEIDWTKPGQDFEEKRDL